MRNAGFTLIEVLIVAAVIALLASIAVPNLMRSRISSNETSAIADLRAVCAAELDYQGSHMKYTGDWNNLTGNAPPYLTGGDWGAPEGRHGYVLTLAGNDNGYEVSATPITQDVTGIRGFFLDTSGIIRAGGHGTADASSPPLGKP